MNVSLAVAHQIAALPWRITPGGVEVALVSTRDTRRWVIPKGWPMPGLSDPESAAREAFEEAGLIGQISMETIGRFHYNKRKKNNVIMPVRVTVYPMQVTQELEIWPEQHQRVRAWFHTDAAASLVQEDGMRELLKAFKPL